MPRFKKGNIPWNKGEKIEIYCRQCGKGFSVHPYRKETSLFCSVKHKGLWMRSLRGERTPGWKGGKDRLPKCLVCSKKLAAKSSKHCQKHTPHAQMTKIHLENLRKSVRRGKNHPNWNPNREEVTKNQRNDGGYKQWVKKVKKRDNWKCRISNNDCSGYCIVHHILPWADFPELRYNINNGITLCQAHHPRKRAEEKILIPFFNELVLISKV